MKKYIGALSSALMGILAFVFLSLPFLVSKTEMSAFGQTKTDKSSAHAWDLLKNLTADDKGGVFFKVFAIVTIILAVLLIISAILVVLKNTKVLKAKINFNLINNILLALFALSAILLVVAAFVVRSGMLNVELGEAFKLSISVGVGAWLNLVVAVLTCAAGWALARK